MPEPTATQTSRMRSTQNERPRASAGSPHLESVGFQPLGRCWWLPGRGTGPHAPFPGPSPAMAARPGHGGMEQDVGGRAAVHGQQTRRSAPHDPQRKPGTGAFALPHLTDSNSRTGTRAPVEW